MDTNYEGGSKNKKTELFNKIQKRKDYKRFDRSLRQVGLRVNIVKGDGNCLFRSIAD